MSKEICSKCGHHLTVLFYTKSCDRCSSASKEDWFYHGYVVWRNPEDLLWSCQEHPIFRKAYEADHCRKTGYGASLFEVREVIAREPFYWVQWFPDNHEVSDISYKVVERFDLYDGKKPSVMILPGDILLPNEEVLILTKQDRKALGLDW